MLRQKVGNLQHFNESFEIQFPDKWVFHLKKEEEEEKAATKLLPRTIMSVILAAAGSICIRGENNNTKILVFPTTHSVFQISR